MTILPPPILIHTRATANVPVPQPEILPPPDYGFEFTDTLQRSGDGLVTLKAPKGISYVCDMNGNMHAVDKGQMRVPADDGVSALLRRGFQKMPE